MPLIIFVTGSSQLSRDSFGFCLLENDANNTSCTRLHKRVSEEALKQRSLMGIADLPAMEDPSLLDLCSLCKHVVYVLPKR